MNHYLKHYGILLAVLGVLALTGALRAVDGASINPNTDASLLQFTSNGHVLGFAKDSVYVANGRQALRLEFVKANLVAPVNTSPASESSVIPSLTRVDYPNLWKGVTLTYDAPEGGILRSTFRIEPYADVKKIRLRYNVPVMVEPNGALVIAYEKGLMRESPPRAWQERPDGGQEPVEVWFESLREREVGYGVNAYDPARPLFIDPTLTWNTFLGGGAEDDPNAITVDGNGNVYVVGISRDTWGSPIRSYSGNYDGFVAKLGGNGNLLWHTFLGGSNRDTAGGVAVDGNGNVYVAGSSWADWGFPVNPYLAADAFVAKLDGSGNLIWNTFLGSVNAIDSAGSVAVHGNGNIYVAGASNATWGSPILPFVGGPAGNPSDAFVAKLYPSGNLIWNTFLGGSDTDFSGGIAVGGNENVFVTGQSGSTWGSPLRGYTGGRDVFVARLDSLGNLIWNTFLGGTYNDYQAGIGTDGNENVFVVGSSEDTWGSPVRPFTAGSRDIFAAKLNGSGGLIWHTFLGGSEFELYAGIALDGSGNVFIAGQSGSTWGSPIHPFAGGFDDAFVAGLDGNGNLIWNTFLGSSSDEAGKGIAVDGSGNIFIAGFSVGSWGSPIRAYTGGTDAFVAKLSNGPQAKIFLPLILRQ
jgi:hypothetical protein